MFTGGCVKCVSRERCVYGVHWWVCGVHVYGRGVSRVFTGGCVKCVSTGEVCLGCSLVGVWSACLWDRCL